MGVVYLLNLLYNGSSDGGPTQSGTYFVLGGIYDNVAHLQQT